MGRDEVYRMKKEALSNQTKQRMAQSLKKLMTQKPLDKITVRDVFEDCGMARQTFYYHFADLYDLMYYMFDSELTMAMNGREKTMNWDEGMLTILDYVKENRQVCLCAYDSLGQEGMRLIFSKRAEELMGNYLNRLRLDYPRACDADVDTIREFLTMTLASIIADWLINPKGRSPEDTIRQVDLVYHGTARAALSRSSAFPSWKAGNQ